MFEVLIPTTLPASDTIICNLDFSAPGFQMSFLKSSGKPTLG